MRGIVPLPRSASARVCVARDIAATSSWLVAKKLCSKMPRGKLTCLALDLDSTLIYSSPDLDLYHELGIATDPELFDVKANTWRMRLYDVVTPHGEGEAEDWWFSKRPGLSNFLEHARDFYDIVGVWTAAKQRYAEGIVEEIALDMGEPDFLWHRDMCGRGEGGCLTKPLRYLSDELGIPVEQITIVDDTETTFVENKSRAVHIPRWEPHFSVDGLRCPDNALEQIVEHWSSCRRMENPDSAAPCVRFSGRMSAA